MIVGLACVKDALGHTLMPFFSINTALLCFLLGQADFPFTSCLMISLSIGTSPNRGRLWSNHALFRFRNNFWTGLDPRVAFTLLFLFISYKLHFTSATKKKVTDVTANIG